MQQSPQVFMIYREERRKNEDGIKITRISKDQRVQSKAELKPNKDTSTHTHIHKKVLSITH